MGTSDGGELDRKVNSSCDNLVLPNIIPAISSPDSMKDRHSSRNYKQAGQKTDGKLNLTNLFSDQSNSRCDIHAIQDSHMLEMHESRTHRSAQNSGFDKTERVGRSFERNQSKKFKSPERNQFRYNMIYNKMSSMLNDKRFIRKGNDPDGNMSLQAKLLMSVPSYSSINNQSYLMGSGSVPRDHGQLPFLSSPSLKSPAKFTKRSNLNSDSAADYNQQKHSQHPSLSIPYPDFSLTKKGKVSYSVSNRNVINPFQEGGDPQNQIKDLIKSCARQKADGKMSLQMLN